MTEHVERLLQKLQLEQPVIAERDRRYRGDQPLRFATADIEGDFNYFSVNIYRAAVNAVAERMRVKKIRAVLGDGEDVSENVAAWWDHLGMDMKLQATIADVLAVGSAYLIVWMKDGKPTITVETAEQVTTMHHAITGEVEEAVKRWYEKDAQGVVVHEHVVHYGRWDVVRYVRGANGKLVERQRVHNPLGVVPVVPLINVERIGDRNGHSVIDDLSNLVDALSKILADMLVASEVVARPKRYATGVSLEESTDAGFSADDDFEEFEPTAVEAPFAGGADMFVTEQADAKFGQLPGADLAGYKTAVELITQQIMTVSALPAHMIGVTTSNPASSDAIRAAEASLTARAESRALVLGLALEEALKLLVALTEGADVDQVGAWIEWRDFATRSQAQEADAVTKLHSLGILTTNEAREMIGLSPLQLGA